MLGIGITEMILIGGIALVVIGPDKFPEFAKIVLRTVRDLRGYVDEMKDEVSKELRPVQKELNDLSRYDPEQYIDSLTNSEDHANESESDTAEDSSNDDSYGEDSEDGSYKDDYHGEQDKDSLDPYGTGEMDTSDELLDEGLGSTVPEPQPGEEHTEDTDYPATDESTADAEGESLGSVPRDPQPGAETDEGAGTFAEEDQDSDFGDVPIDPPDRLDG